jgi:hypothetical protein
MTIGDYGFVQHSFNRNPGYLLPPSSLFSRIAFKTLYVSGYFATDIKDKY